MRKTTPHEIWLNAAWRGHVELMLHLCQGAQNTVLVIGPKQVGKTTLYHYFLRQTIAHSRMVGLTAQAWDNAELLMEAVAEALSLPIGEGLTAFQTVKNTLETFSSSHPTIVLLIDDAHLLSDELLQALYALLKCDTDLHPAFHLVLLGEPSLELQLFSPQISPMINGRIYTIELEGWSLPDVRQYLLKDSGLTLLSPDQISEIFEHSQGLPGLVQIAREALLQEKENAMGKQSFFRWRKSPIIIGALVGLIGGGFYILMNQLPSNVAQSDQITLPLDQAEEGQLPAIMAEKIDQSDIIEADAHEHPESEELDLSEQIMRDAQAHAAAQARAETQENMHAVVHANSEAAAQTQIAAQVNAKAITHLHASEQTKAAALTQLSQQEASIETLPVSVIASPEMDSDIDDESGTLDEEGSEDLSLQSAPQPIAQPAVSMTEKEKYLLSLDSKAYTLQLVGARSEENVKQFMAKHGLGKQSELF